MDTRNLTEYPDELVDLLRERFGPKAERRQPTRYTAATYLIRAVAGLLTEDDFAAYLHAALRGDAASRPQADNWPISRSFTDHFSRELRTNLGALEEGEGRQEAWHIMCALHDILAPDLFGPVVRCASDAWENTTETVRRLAGV